MGKLKKNEWKPLGINLENAEELTCFEQLTDYEIIRGGISEPSHSIEEDEPRKKRKRKKTSSSRQTSQKNTVKRKQTEANSPIPAKKTKNTFSEEEVPEVATSVTESEPNLENVDSWKPFNLPEPILKALAAKKFENPTEIQVC